MAALNREETEHLSLAERAMQDAVARLKRATEDPIALAGDPEKKQIVMDLSEADFIIESLAKANKLVNTVKQMKGYYPK